MTEVANNLQDVYAAIGLTSPPSRFLATAAATTLLVEALKLDYTHNKDGTHRDWALMSPDSKSGTMIPWFIPGVVVGTAAAVFL